MVDTSSTVDNALGRLVAARNKGKGDGRWRSSAKRVPELELTLPRDQIDLNPKPMSVTRPDGEIKIQRGEVCIDEISCYTITTDE